MAEDNSFAPTIRLTRRKKVLPTDMERTPSPRVINKLQGMMHLFQEAPGLIGHIEILAASLGILLTDMPPYSRYPSTRPQGVLRMFFISSIAMQYPFIRFRCNRFYLLRSTPFACVLQFF